MDDAVSTTPPPRAAPAAPAPGNAQPSRPRMAGTFWKVLLVLAVLALHLLTRQRAARTMPLESRQFYPHAYATSLALRQGLGFSHLALQKVPEARPLVEFLALKRERVTEPELQAYFARPDSRQTITDLDDSTRILDMYVAAAIWKLCGVSWPAFFLFYSVVSTAVCLMIFLMGRELGGSYWAGLAAAVLFMASPLENEQAILSTRDVNPLWFTALVFCLLICVVDRFKSARWNYLSYVGLGVAAIVGFGWRTDALLLPLFAGGILAIQVFLNHRNWKYTGVPLLLFVAAVWGTRTTILALGPDTKARRSNLVGFHIAYYGHAVRDNLLAIENSFQTVRDDQQTESVACQCRSARHPDKPRAVWGADSYGEACRDIYLEGARYNAYRYLSGFPSFFCRALGGLSQSPRLQGEDANTRELIRSPRLKLLYTLILDHLTECLPWLFAVGVVFALLIGPRPLLAGALGAFSLYYSAALFLVLPEHKHVAPLLLPLTVLGGAGIFLLAKAINARLRHKTLPVISRQSAVVTGIIALAAALMWGCGCVAARWYSTGVRQAYLAEVMRLADKGTDAAADTLRNEQVFAVRMAPTAEPDSAGYLLTIRTGAAPGILTCDHVRPPGPGYYPLAYRTRHRLRAEQEEYFTVHCMQGRRTGDSRAYACTVRVSGDARIVACKRYDLADWKHLPLSTVFHAGDATPGSPIAGDGLPTTQPIPVTWEASGTPTLAFAVGGELVIATCERQEDGPFSLPLELFAPAANGTRVTHGAGRVQVETLPAPGAYALRYPLLAVARGGTYLAQLRCQVATGAVSFGALAQDETAWVARSTADEQHGDDVVKTFKVSLKPADKIVLMIANNHPQANQPSHFTVKSCTVQKTR